MSSEYRKPILKIALSSVLLIAAVIVEKNSSWEVWQYLLLYLPAWLVAGADTLREAAEAVSEGKALDENFLMSVATVGAMLIGFLPGAQAQFPEAVLVMLLFQAGELIEDVAEGRSRRSISHLMDIRPDIAHVRRGGGWTDVNPSEVESGEILLVRPGEKIPLDGIVTEGSSNLDTVALTGESLPRPAGKGDEVLSGCVNMDGVLTLKALRPFGESTASRIIRLVEDAAENKSRSEAFITRFAKVYTPVVVSLALLVSVVPPLFGGAWADWIYRGLMFLVVSCPCALVISVPLTFFGGIGGASRCGILVKGASFMDSLSRLGTVVFDKTGTLTEGVFEVVTVHAGEMGEEELLHLAAHVEMHSTHPVAAALRQAWPGGQDDGCSVGDIREIAGRGLTARVNGNPVAVGNGRLMEDFGLAPEKCPEHGTVVHVACGDPWTYAGHIIISDKVKEDAADAVRQLHELGVGRVEMLTGDRKEAASAVASLVGADSWRAELLPQGKVDRVAELLNPGRTLAFVGDGINDAPVLARADVGIAMGALGSDAAIEAADVVLMDDKPSKVALAVRIARRTLRIAKENIIFAIGVKLTVLVLAACGAATLGMAVFADVGVTLLAVLNALRALRQA
ncbi:MAG: cadmium-translocating P-type ATPase [Bacteroidales bacterium]|nr:cadmium-translocating P-type ATPase [Bacteroidales bacterium]